MNLFSIIVEYVFLVLFHILYAVKKKIENIDDCQRSFSKLDLCEGGRFSPTIFNSNIELNVSPISCFIYVCPFVALSKATYAENSHIVWSSRHSKAFIFTSCVF